MIGRIIPKEVKFFEYFDRSADLIVEGAHEFKALLLDLKHSDNRSRNIKEIENRADEVTHQTIELLHKTFITPLDRLDIHELITSMDDILDFIEAASQRINLYKITECPPPALELAETCIKSVELIREAVNGLHKLKNPQVILKACIEINRLENDADHTLRKAIADLFENETDVKKIIKYKEIFEMLETVTDCCEDVANIIDGIVLEYS